MFDKLRRGDIYSADLSPSVGSEQSGSRPVLVLQNNIGNCFSPTIIIAAITGVNKKSPKFPTHYHLKKRRLKKYIGHLNAADMNNIDETLLQSLGISRSG